MRRMKVEWKWNMRDKGGKKEEEKRTEWKEE